MTSAKDRLIPLKLNFNHSPCEGLDPMASPVTMLTQTMGGLTTDSGKIGKQRRRTTWSASTTPKSSFLSSLDDSPNFQDSPMFQERVLKSPENKSKFMSRMRCYKDNKENFPKQVLHYPAENISDDSQDSGYSGSKSQLSSILSSPRSSCRFLSRMDEEEEFTEVLGIDHFDEETQMPQSFDSLLQKPILATQSPKKILESDYSKETSPVMCHSGKESPLVPLASSVNSSTPFLPLSTSTCNRLGDGNFVKRPVFKRPIPLHSEVSPISQPSKKLCQIGEHFSLPEPLTSSESLHKRSPLKALNTPGSYSKSVMEAVLKSTADPGLIGDFSKPYTLPLVLGKHQDLKSISPSTVAKLMRGEYKVDEYVIIDCRYPYEYEGGHIKGAVNIYTKEGIMDKFISSYSHPAKTSKDKCRILVFHCEFSSERGPSLSRFLRNMDREVNRESYPSLHHPEVYVLNGGYKAFYEQYRELCQPQTYKPMLHQDHGSDLRKFRSKSKSWSHSKSVTVRTGLKF